MSLPARQQRALDGLESALCAGDPHLTGMFTVFARLNSGDPVTAEPMARRARRRWLRPGRWLSALGLVPVALALIVTGAVFGGARTVKTCVAAPFGSRPVCQAYRPPAAAKKMTAVGSEHDQTPAWPPR